MYINRIKWILVACLSLVAWFATYAFNEDSLLNVLPRTSGAERFEVLYELAKYNYNNTRDFEKTESYILEAKELATELRDSVGIVKSCRILGNVKLQSGFNEEAIQVLSYALSIAKRNGIQDYVRYLTNSLAVASINIAAYDKALEYNFQSLVYREQTGDKLEISIALNNIGVVYYKIADVRKALTYFERSLELRKEIGSDYQVPTLKSNIALCYVELKQFEDAVEAAKEALSSCDEECSDEVIMGSYFVLGNVQAEADAGTPNLAREYFVKSLDAAKAMRDAKYIVDCTVLIGKTFAQEGNTGEALRMYGEAEVTLDSLDLRREKVNLYKELYNLYKDEGDLAKTVEYQNKYINLYDSLMNSELIKNVARIQTNFEERQNVLTIARQKRLNVSVVIIACLAILLVFVLYHANIVKKKVNRQLSEAKNTIEAQNKQLSALNRNLEKMVDARTQQLKSTNEALKRVNSELDNFIYKTSHDIRGPLASLKGMCNVALLDVKDPLALEYFAKLDLTAERLNTILTRLLIINQINNSAPAYELIDLSELLDDVILTQKKKGIPHRMTFGKDVEPDLVFYSDKALVRIILENLVDNAIKFYNDSERISPKVLVKAHRNDKEIHISVMDNGIGITQVDPDKIFQMFSRASERSDTGGIGLYLTKTATEKIGGRIDLRTTPDGYTEFCVTFAIQNGRMRREGAA